MLFTALPASRSGCSRGKKALPHSMKPPGCEPDGFVVFRSPPQRSETMQIGQTAATDKPARNRLPDRRSAVTTTFHRDGACFEMTIGYYPDGKVGEVFLNADRANSLLDFLMSDAAILASLALQYGAPLDEIRAAMKRDAAGKAS